MTLPLENIIITIDTREQNQKRIKAVETWGLAYGAIIEHSKLDLCDYRILGDFRGHDINIGIEAKGLSDFCSCDYEDLKRKLFDSYDLYDDVALFIESGNYSFLNEGFGKSAIINQAVRDGSANICNLAQLEGCVHTLERYGIYVNQLRSEAQFPYSIENILTYCINDHDIIKHDPKMYLRAYKHTLQSFMTNVQVKKAISSYPNLHWLCSASEESYKEIFGRKAGSQIYNFIRNSELMTEEWKTKKFYDGTDKTLTCTYNENKPCDQVNAYVCVGKECKFHPDFKSPDVSISFPGYPGIRVSKQLYSISDKIKGAIVDYLTEEYPHALTIDELCAHFNIMQGDEDKEAFLIYIKELAWEKKITNTVSGELTIINHKSQSHCDPVGTFLKPPIYTPKTIISPTDDIDKSTEGLEPPIIPSVPLQSSSTEQKGSNPASGGIDKGTQSRQMSEPTKPIPSESKLGTHGNVQEKDLKLVSSNHPPSSPAITPNEDDDLFGKTNPDWKVETHRMSARVQLESYLQNPHTLQECVDKFDMFTSGTIFEHIARMKKEGVIIEFNDKTLVMAK